MSDPASIARFASLLTRVRRYYDEKLALYGATPRGVDWNSAESQELRFQILLQVCDRAESFSINDYGCGYGALVDYLTTRGYAFRYRGFDLSEDMIAMARASHKDLDHSEFVTDRFLLTPTDYTVASGLFNVRLDTPTEHWEQYIFTTLGEISSLSLKGFAFNMLTTYSDRERMRPDLYYADPCSIFDYCKTRFSRHVSLLHDYALYEFTILVRT